MKMRFGIFCAAAVSMILLMNCKKEEEKSTVKESSATTTSHNDGMTCGTCHKTEGTGSGIFVTGGTVYDASGTVTVAGAKVKFYTAVNGGGTLLKTLVSDQAGNFYTTDAFALAGSYVVVESSAGTPAPMNMVLDATMGNCNSCHGDGNRVYTE